MFLLHILPIIQADVNPKKSSWSILSGNDDGAFTIDPQTGELYVADGSLLDYETEPSRTLTVEVDDGRKSYSAIITINIGNVYDTVPTHTYPVSSGGCGRAVFRG